MPRLCVARAPVFLVRIHNVTVASLIRPAILPLYPLILVKTLSQSKQSKVSGKRSSALDKMAEIQSSEGVGGLYRGLEGQLAKCVVQQGMTLLVKQRSVIVVLYKLVTDVEQNRGGRGQGLYQTTPLEKASHR